MVGSIVKIVFSGIMLLLGLSLFYSFFGGYFSFVVYHLNLAQYLFSGSVLEPQTVRVMSLAFLLLILIPVFRKIRGVFGA